MSDKFAMQSWPLRRYDFPMPIRYHLSEENVKRVVICLHGYQDHALSLLRRLGWWEDKTLPFPFLAINGPFPVPLWLADGFKEAYSWYFRDVSRELDFVSPQTTAERLRDMVRDLNLESAHKVIFGFSQGGYLAPYLAAELKNVRGVIGYGTGYPAENYERGPKYKIFAVHGERDERIDPTHAKKEFDAVIASGRQGEFHLIPKLTHKVDATVEPLIRRLIQSCWS